jgi:CRP/FNR family nitrogen fixation transcriptional regulator
MRYKTFNNKGVRSEDPPAKGRLSMTLTSSTIRASAATNLPAPANLYRDAAAAIESLAAMTSCQRGQEIYGHEDSTEHWYRIVSGMARKSTLLIDGRRRILDFLLPGDFFGFSARNKRAFDVEAVIDGTVIACYPRRLMERLADGDPEVNRQIRHMAFESISRLQSRVLILGRPTALNKVCAFLMEMANRSDEEQSEVIVLPMSRYDIADYLALSVETVSRTLTHLKQLRAIALTDKHRVTITNRKTLEEGSSYGASR